LSGSKVLAICTATRNLRQCVVRSAPIFGHRGAPAAQLISSRFRIRLPYAVVKEQILGLRISRERLFYLQRAFPRGCTNSPKRERGKGDTLPLGQGDYAILLTSKLRILVISLVSSLRFIATSTQRCGFPFSS
jgi:hypothetical protein